MSFWDSAILGVIVGGVIGGCGKFAYDIRVKNQLCESLERGIKAEAKVIKDSIKPTEDFVRNHLGFIKNRGTPTTTYEPFPEVKMSFTEANLGNIGMLDMEFLEPLIEVRATLGVFPKAIELMWNTHNELVDGNEQKRKVLVQQLSGFVNASSGIRENCERLLKHEGNYSTTDTVIRYFRNMIGKIFKKYKK